MRETQKPVVQCIVSATIHTSNQILDIIAKSVTNIAQRMVTLGTRFYDTDHDSLHVSLRIFSNDGHDCVFEGSGTYRTEQGDTVTFRIEIILMNTRLFSTERLRWEVANSHPLSETRRAQTPITPVRISGPSHLAIN